MIEVREKRRSGFLYYSAAIVALLFSFNLYGQRNLNEDTIHIKEVVISRKKNIPDMPGYSSRRLDSVVIKNYPLENMAELLSGNSLIFVKSYGSGGSATTSVRGAGASHTQLTWNEININNPMAGQTDLSLIPACFIDDIQIYTGGASMSLNSGGIGGIINLETNPVWKNETSVMLNPGFSSFGKYSGSVSVKSGNSHFQTVTKIFLETAENDFRYLDNETTSQPFWETRKNSQSRQKGYLQELYVKNKKSVTSARIWYQSASRNLPSPIVVQQLNENEKQFDESLRTMLNFKTSRGRFDYSLTGALMLNRLNYFNRLVSIDSRNLSEKMTLKAIMETSLRENTKIKFSINDELSAVKSNNYDHTSSRNNLNLTASIRKMCNNRLGTTILIREIINNRTFLLPDFTAGLEYRIIEGKEYFLKGNLGKNSKVPDMNDIFWTPGGNPDLKNEYAFSGEINFEMSEKIFTPVNLNFDMSLFKNSIKDMIQWHQGEFSYWTADNIQRVNSIGAESSVALTYSNNNITVVLKSLSSITRAKDMSNTSSGFSTEGKQIMYIPIYQSNTSLRIYYKKFNASWIADYTGKRFISADNSRYLPGYVTNSIKTGIKHSFKSISLDLNFSINNLFNTNYQVIAWHPMPGRSYSLGILIHFVK
jgi:iron complex outermembrane receptor protein